MPRAVEHIWNGFKLALIEHDGLSEDVRKKGTWEPHFVELAQRLIHEGDVVCDAGANFGIHTLLASRLVGRSGRVYAFEPQPTIFHQLCYHLFSNGVMNVRAFPFALADGPGRTRIPDISELMVQNLGATHVGHGAHIVDVIALDHFVHEPFNFLKVDIQGCELRFLRGAARIIAATRPFMFIEVEEMYLRPLGTSSKELIEHLLALDYVLFRVLTDYPCDHLCVPREKLDITSSKLTGFSWPLERIDGREVSLTFSGKPHYDAVKVVR